LLEQSLIDIDQMMELDVTCNHSCLRVSNDNSFSESQFRTQKHQSDYPGRFNGIQHARLHPQFGAEKELTKSRKN
tara:strand:+ start:2164 stop:2388 length:225 start_codon:yes stop_codon:yes gene_type:complete